MHYSKSKDEGKYQESIQSSTPPDSGHHMRKRQNSNKSYILWICFHDLGNLKADIHEEY